MKEEGRPSGEFFINLTHGTWSGGPCGRKNCLPCINGDGKQDCFTKNCVYDIICLKCAGDDKENQGGKHSVYTGETSRCQHLRGAEHMSGLLSKRPNNALYKHVTDVHQGEFKLLLL